MKSIVQRELRQKSPPPSLEAEVFLALQLAANRLLDPWARYLKAEGLTHGQYNVLRILRGARPEALTCGEIAGRMISRDPDITRLLDRLDQQGLVERHRDAADRRAVRTRISPSGLSLLERLEIPSVMVHGALAPLGRRRLQELNSLLAAVIEQAGSLADGPEPSFTTHTRK
jgi:DNA-binding MarR family transcriptional regulator